MSGYSYMDIIEIVCSTAVIPLIFSDRRLPCTGNYPQNQTAQTTQGKQRHFMIWQTTNMEIPYQLFMEGNGAVGLINGFKLDLTNNPISLDVTMPRGTAPDIRPANQIISLLRARSVRSKRRQTASDGEHGASPCALSITAGNRKDPEFPRIRKQSTQAGCVNTGSHFSNEVSAKVARQSSFSLRGHNTENTKKQGSESLPTHFMNKIKTMKNKNNPFTVSSMQRCCNTNRAGRSLRFAGPISIALALIAHAVVIALALAGVNPALISAVVLLIVITFGAQEARIASKTEHNCRSIQ